MEEQILYEYKDALATQQIVLNECGNMELRFHHKFTKKHTFVRKCDELEDVFSLIRHLLEERNKYKQACETKET